MANLSQHCYCHSQFREILKSSKKLRAERRILAQNHLDPMSFSALECLNSCDPSSRQLPDCNNPDLLNLFHLKRRVVPHFGTKAAGELEGIPNTN